MSEKVRVRLLLAKFPEDDEPTIVGCVDEHIWEHWDERDEERWRASSKVTWGLDHPTEWREVWAEFAPDDLVAAYQTPVVQGRVA